jgi:hypothetical protein
MVDRCTGQLFALDLPLGEGANSLIPSSFEIKFPAKRANHPDGTSSALKLFQSLLESQIDGHPGSNSSLFLPKMSCCRMPTELRGQL